MPSIDPKMGWSMPEAPRRGSTPQAVFLGGPNSSLLSKNWLCRLLVAYSPSNEGECGILQQRRPSPIVLRGETLVTHTTQKKDVGLSPRNLNKVSGGGLSLGGTGVIGIGVTGTGVFLFLVAGGKPHRCLHSH